MKHNKTSSESQALELEFVAMMLKLGVSEWIPETANQLEAAIKANHQKAQTQRS